MEIGLAGLASQLVVGLSRAMILFIVCAGLSFVLGVLRVPNVAHMRISLLALLSIMVSGYLH